MATALDVAGYFIARSYGDDEGITNLKLQKLLYYAQGFHIALYDESLFDDRIEAWTHGPVCPTVYHVYKENKNGPIFEACDIDFDERFTPDQKDLLDEVYELFGQFSAWKLRNMTHDEPPWRDNQESGLIEYDDMKEFFKTLLN